MRIQFTASRIWGSPGSSALCGKMFSELINRGIRFYDQYVRQSQREISYYYSENCPQEVEHQKGRSFALRCSGRRDVLIPEPKRYTFYLKGLHGDIWKGVDIQNYLNGERGAWMESGSK